MHSYEYKIKGGELQQVKSVNSKPKDVALNILTSSPFYENETLYIRPAWASASGFRKYKLKLEPVAERVGDTPNDDEAA